MNGLIRRIGGAVAAVVVLAAVSLLPSWPAAAATPTVTMTIDDVSPNTPTIGTTPKPLVFSISLTNHSTHAFDAVTIAATRSDPIYTQIALDAAIAKPKAPSPDQAAPLDTTVKTSLGANATAQVTLRTTIGTDPTSAEVFCCYQDAIFPFYFTASSAGDNGTVQLATAQTYLPAFSSPPTAKAEVGWVWPLLDRPHRLKQENLFGDDELAGEVQRGGRLDKLLNVLERVAGTVPMTVLTDPDLIDELAVMTSPGGYRVVTPSGIVRGTGGSDAAAWLGRLDTLLDEHPQLELEFTPYADPAVESLTRSGLTWSTTLSPAMKQRVTTALNGRIPSSDIAWPAGQTLSARTLGTLVKQGAHTVILNDHALTGPRATTVGTSANGDTHAVPSDALAPLTTPAGRPVTVGVTSTPIERLVAQILAPAGKGLALLPELVAQLSIRVLTSVNTSHYVLITPPRNLDIAPDIAVRTILATSTTTWAAPLPLGTATQTITPVDHGRLRADLRSPQLPARTLTAVHTVTNALPTLADLYKSAAVAKAETDAYPAALQRCESSSFLSQRQASIDYAAVLQRQIDSTQAGVRLVPPSRGTYTLTSRNANLPVTIINSLPADVEIKVEVTTDDGVPGLTGGDTRPRTIRANQRAQLQVPTHIDRVGLINVTVSVTTRDGLSLPSSIPLKIRSTALGTVGVVITVVAAIVLAVALLVRFIRRFRHRRKPSAPPPAPDQVPAGTAAS